MTGKGMELRHLRYFIAVAQELNFTRAAEKLFTSQPSLSSQIRDLESSVGVALFERDRRRVELTAAGLVFLEDARDILARAESAQARARRAMQEEHSLCVGFVPCAEVNVLPHVMPPLRERFPQTKISLMSLITTVQEEKLLSGELDVGFMRAPIYSTDIESRVVYRESLMAVLPAGHALAGEPVITPGLINGQEFISTDPEFSGSLPELVQAWLGAEQCLPQIVQTGTNILATMNLVGMGLGISILPAYMECFNAGSVIFRPLTPNPPEIELLMAWRRDDDNPVLQDMLKLCLETE